MNLIRYQFPNLTHGSPFDRLSSFRNEINRLFNDGAPARNGTSAADWTPALDVYDEKDRYVVSVELPGLKKEEINLAVYDGVLTVSGERKSEREGKEGQTARSERFFGKFERSVTLPAAVNTANVTANYKDGVLLIELPKAEEAKPKQIQVHVS